MDDNNHIDFNAPATLRKWPSIRIERFGVHTVMLADAAGILTIDRVRTLVPALKQASMLAELKAHARMEGRDPNRVQWEPWQHRDLRRTARTLMARSEVPSDIAELCMGHVKKSVERTYDKHDYLDRKQVAFKSRAAVRSPAAGHEHHHILLRSLPGLTWRS
jgi:hypothetical protein